MKRWFWINHQKVNPFGISKTKDLNELLQVETKSLLFTFDQRRTGKGGERDFPLEFCVRQQFVSYGKLHTTATTT